MNRVGVIQLTDTLALGGLERVAVNLANHLPCERFRSHLCATRASGPLAAFVAKHVQQCILERSSRFDLRAIRRLLGYLDQHQIQLIHAHGTSLFVAAAVKVISPRLTVVWHDHFGRYDTEQRPSRLYRLAASRVDGVIAVNTALANWSRDELGVRDDRVWYLPNFVAEPNPKPCNMQLPGIPGKRLVCVANLRPEKDHRNLILALKTVRESVPDIHLILIGGAPNAGSIASIQDAIFKAQLEQNVTWLGVREDVDSILGACDLGVLSSASEGLPLALLEYGMAGLPVITTRVGQCAEVLADGEAGILVPAGDPMGLATSILSLLRSPEKRAELGLRLSKRVREQYSASAAVRRLCQIYQNLLDTNHKRA